MKILVQRVAHASVQVRGATVGAIGRGLLALVGFDRDDSTAEAERLLDRMLAYRLFADAEGRMNRSVRDVGGGVLLVSQFTLSADTRRGLRPSFSSAMAPEQAQALYSHCLHYLQQRHAPVAGGEFAADMQVALLNDGPVTFMLQSP